jgi:hypothetical protein
MTRTWIWGAVGAVVLAIGASAWLLAETWPRRRCAIAADGAFCSRENVDATHAIRGAARPTGNGDELVVEVASATHEPVYTTDPHVPVTTAVLFDDQNRPTTFVRARGPRAPRS